MTSPTKTRKYYIRGDVLPVEEDSLNEFKGHLNLCAEDIPAWSVNADSDKPTRKPISRNLNAFLNSGMGGTVYLGVMDDGKIMGFRLSWGQRDHFGKALDDLMSRYKPRVLPHQYQVRFTPVFNETITKEQIQQRLESMENEEMPALYKDRGHTFQKSGYCWCDKDSVASYNATNSEGPQYVVEVSIVVWDQHDPRNAGVGVGSLIRFQPYYSDEEGKVNFRRQASVVQYNMDTIAQITRMEVREKYQAEIKRLEEKCAKMELEKAARLKREADSSEPRRSSP
ncbi:hypothetical protein ACOMHN_037681 [Nucella lapillus]